MRIDVYLKDNYDYSRTEASKMIKQGLVLVNGKTTKNSYKINENDKIEIIGNLTYENNLEKEKMDLDIIYEDDDIIVLNKQSGLVVHPGAGNQNHTLVNALMYHTNFLSDIQGENRLGIVHRLDKDTSGLMLVAKTNKAHKILSEDFKNKRVKREYVAIINGNFPHDNACIDAPIGRNNKSRKEMSVTSKNSKNAVTHLKVLKRYKDYTLVSLVLETGRTHQIRVHLSYIGYPVLNDPVYSKKKSDSYGQYLHSKKITFKHPITKKDMVFETDYPEEFKNFLKKLD